MFFNTHDDDMQFELICTELEIILKKLQQDSPDCVGIPLSKLFSTWLVDTYGYSHENAVRITFASRLRASDASEVDSVLKVAKLAFQIAETTVTKVLGRSPSGDMMLECMKLMEEPE